MTVTFCCFLCLQLSHKKLVLLKLAFKISALHSKRNPLSISYSLADANIEHKIMKHEINCIR